MLLYWQEILVNHKYLATLLIEPFCVPYLNGL